MHLMSIKILFCGQSVLLQANAQGWKEILNDSLIFTTLNILLSADHNKPVRRRGIRTSPYDNYNSFICLR